MNRAERRAAERRARRMGLPTVSVEPIESLLEHSAHCDCPVRTLDPLVRSCPACGADIVGGPGALVLPTLAPVGSVTDVHGWCNNCGQEHDIPMLVLG